MISMEIKIQGLAELDAELKKFPMELQRKALGQMVGAGAKIVKDAATQNFMNVAKTLNLDPDEKYWSLKNIVTRRMKKKDKGKSTLTYGVKAQYPAFYLETGIRPHTITAKKAKSLGNKGQFGKSVQHPGYAPRPFLRPALDNNVQRVINAMGYKLMAWMDRQYKKGVMKRA
jgi:HK97 gp10 family phage protein